jgi:hypothetical protein
MALYAKTARAFTVVISESEEQELCLKPIISTKRIPRFIVCFIFAYSGKIKTSQAKRWCQESFDVNIHAQTAHQETNPMAGRFQSTQSRLISPGMRTMSTPWTCFVSALFIEVHSFKSSQCQRPNVRKGDKYNRSMIKRYCCLSCWFQLTSMLILRS